jgi:hypothetical protein
MIFLVRSRIDSDCNSRQLAEGKIAIRGSQLLENGSEILLSHLLSGLLEVDRFFTPANAICPQRKTIFENNDISFKAITNSVRTLHDLHA